MVFHDHMLKSFLFFTFSRVILVNKTRRSISHYVSRKNIKVVKSFMFIFEQITHTKLLQIIKNWPPSSKYVQKLFHRHSFLWQKPTRQFFFALTICLFIYMHQLFEPLETQVFEKFYSGFKYFDFFSVLRFKYIGL